MAEEELIPPGVSGIPEEPSDNESLARMAGSGVHAGFPSPAQDYMDSFIDLNKELVRHPAATFYARVVGDSMIDAGISDGDLVVVRKTTEANDGDIVVALTEETGTTLKRLLHEKGTGKVILHPENPSMQDMTFQSIAVQGVAVKVIKSI